MTVTVTVTVCFWNKHLQVLTDSQESCVIAEEVRYPPTGTRVSSYLDEVLSHVSLAPWAEALGRNTRPGPELAHTFQEMLIAFVLGSV